MSREIFEAKMAELKASQGKSGTILVAIASVHVIVEKYARTEILNL